MAQQESGGMAPERWQNAFMNDYERIARVIRYIDVHRAEQPSLTVLASVAGLSVFHFHRLFSHWAGVTPKDFLQCISLAHARVLLRQGESVLEAAYATGLSGPGRLHDLAVSLYAATPGEIKSGGEGWIMKAGFAETPFGRCLIASSPRGICHISFADDGLGGAEDLDCLRVEWPRGGGNDVRATGVAARRTTITHLGAWKHVSGARLASAAPNPNGCADQLWPTRHAGGSTFGRPRSRLGSGKK